MKKPAPLTFATIPTWAIDTTPPDRYSVAAAFALADLTNRWVRLRAATQRALWGAALFGKCLLRVSDDGVQVTRSVCFGTDFCQTVFTWSDLERVIASGRRPVL